MTITSSSSSRVSGDASTHPRKIYLLGICGTGMGALAGLFQQLGHQVRGSDEHVYPPMSTKLAEWGIPVDIGFDPEHLVRAQPDLVIVGNAIRAVNPQAVHARKTGIPTLSMPEAVAMFGIGDRHSIVIAGTHGKTTTTSLMAHVLLSQNLDPSFLVGGALIGYPESFRAGRGEFFVIEGDEYDTAYFDKGPKFWHYRPRTAVITSLEFDHADIYASIEAIEASFLGLITRVPTDGHLVVWHGAHRVRKLIQQARASHAIAERVTIYSSTPQADADLYLASYQSTPEGLHMEPVHRGTALGKMFVPLWGDFGAQNALAVIGALLGAGVSAEVIRRGLASYKGVKRRLEVIGEPGGITVVDDFAHHPTAVRETLRGARTRWPGRRLWAIFEPRSATTRRNVFQTEMIDAFAHADHVVIATHERLHEIPEAQRFDPNKLAADLTQRHIHAVALEKVEDIANHICKHAKTGDVILICSNGSFGGLHQMLLKQLGTLQGAHT